MGRRKHRLPNSFWHLPEKTSSDPPEIFCIGDEPVAVEAEIGKNWHKRANMLLKGKDSPWRWCASSMASPLLLEHVESLLQGGSHPRVMNRSRIREVLWVELPGLEPIVLKRYFRLGLPKALWNRVRGFQWRKEWSNSFVLSRMGVLAPKPLLMGEILRNGIPLEGIFVSQAILGASTLTQELKLQGTQRTSLLRALGAYLAWIHDMGILHKDLHGDNLLVGKAGEGGPLFWLLDLHRIRTGKPLGEKNRKWNLAQILMSLRKELTPGEENFLLEAYVENHSPRDLCSWEESIGMIQQRMLRKRQRSKTKRCLQNNSGFAREMIPGGVVIRKRDFPLEAVLKALDKAQETLSPEDQKVLKISGPTRVFRCGLELDGKPLAFCIKEQILRSHWWSVFGALMPSRARRFWVGAWGMMVRDFYVPEPMAMWEVNRGGVFSSGVIMELIQDGVRMDHLVKSLGSQGCMKKQLMKDLAYTLASMHAQGIFHRDLKATNLMVRTTQEGNQILFLDLEDVSFGKRVSRAKIVRNLAQLDASLPDSVRAFSRLKFLRMYMGKEYSRQRFRDLRTEVECLSLQRKART